MMNNKNQIPMALSFDDVYLIPKYSEIESRKSVDLQTYISRNIKINAPIISSPMDTVTGNTKFPIRIAELGGIGIVHRFMPIEKQTDIIKSVKRSHNSVIWKPYIVRGDESIEKLKNKNKELGINSFPVVNSQGKIKGIVTNRDIESCTIIAKNGKKIVKEIMTSYENLKYYMHRRKEKSIEEKELESIVQIMDRYKIEQVPIINHNSEVIGLLSAKDYKKHHNNPYASKDSENRLLVGSAIGVIKKEEEKERIEKLLKKQSDVLVIDVAHGEHKLVKDTIDFIKNNFPKSKYQYDLIVGNVATKKGVKRLESWGADGIRVGIGGGSGCTTRQQTGVGVPQLTSLLNSCNGSSIPIISDGGVKVPGDITKALGAGASCVMIGGYFAGCEETPGKTRMKDGRNIKIFRGMSSYDARADRYDHQKQELPDEYIPEGTEIEVPYKGKLENVFNELVGGLKSGMSYLGARTIQDIWKNAEFVQRTRFCK